MNFRNHFNQLHAILMHATSTEIKFLKNYIKTDTIIQTAIQQALHVKMNPLLEELRDGSIPLAIEFLNQPETNEGDFSNPSSPVVIIIDGDQETSDRKSLPNLAPIPTLPDFPESPTQHRMRKVKYFKNSKISKTPLEGRVLCPKHIAHAHRLAESRVVWRLYN